MSHLARTRQGYVDWIQWTTKYELVWFENWVEPIFDKLKRAAKIRTFRVKRRVM